MTIKGKKMKSVDVDWKEFYYTNCPLISASNVDQELGWVKEGLRDWCITRTLDWGVKFPGHDELVVYVWVDAPIGYISFTEEWAKAKGMDWKRYWCGKNRVTHFIGSDIIYHHCIFWPALLTGAGYSPPHAVVASGMVKIDDQKFSSPGATWSGPARTTWTGASLPTT
jgi:methionyl-tRNA synthetase